MAQVVDTPFALQSENQTRSWNWSNSLQTSHHSELLDFPASFGE